MIAKVEFEPANITFYNLHEPASTISPTPTGNLLAKCGRQYVCLRMSFPMHEFVLFFNMF